MDKLISSVSEYWQVFVSFSPRIIISFLVLVSFYLLGRHLSRLLISLLHRISSKEIHEVFFRVLTLTITMFLGLIITLNILGLEKMAASLLAGGGVTAIVLGFAFREIGENFLAGIFLALSRPFKLGDLIKTEDIEGYVREIELRYTHLRTEDGRDVYVPSSQLFGKPVTNFTKDGLRRTSFTVGIDYSNDSISACTLLKNTVAETAGVLKEPEPDACILNLSPQYVEIEVFFWVDVFDKSSTTLDIRTQVMDKCRKTLLSEGYTVSADTTSNLSIKYYNPDIKTPDK